MPWTRDALYMMALFRSVPLQASIGRESYMADWEYSLILPSGITFTCRYLCLN